MTLKLTKYNTTKKKICGIQYTEIHNYTRIKIKKKLESFDGCCTPQ